MMFTEEELIRYAKNNVNARKLKNGCELESKNYGVFTIIGRCDIDRRKIVVKFNDTGYITKADMSAAGRGDVRDFFNKNHHSKVGFLGGIKYSNATHPSLYGRWNAMIRRCYDTEYQKTNAKTYEGCTVDERWHNFQNYAEDIESIMKEMGIDSLDGYDIDKDIKIKNNKVYSKDTITIVKERGNCMESLVRTRLTGEVYIAERMVDGELIKFDNIALFCNTNNLDRRNVSNVLNGRDRSYKGFLFYRDGQMPSQYIRYSSYINGVFEKSFISLSEYLTEKLGKNKQITFNKNNEWNAYVYEDCWITIKKSYIH